VIPKIGFKHFLKNDQNNTNEEVELSWWLKFGNIRYLRRRAYCHHIQ
jgi:hypothetical protein